MKATIKALLVLLLCHAVKVFGYNDQSLVKNNWHFRLKSNIDFFSHNIPIVIGKTIWPLQGVFLLNLRANGGFAIKICCIIDLKIK